MRSIWRGRQQAFALKITDGNRIAATATTIVVMAQLGWMDKNQAAELETWHSAKIDTSAGKRWGSGALCLACSSLKQKETK